MCSTTLLPKAQETFKKRTQKDSKNQRTGKSVVRVFLLEMSEKALIIPQQYGFLKKTVTTAVDIQW